MDSYRGLWISCTPRCLGQQVLKEHWLGMCETEGSQPCSTRMENGGWLLAVSWARDRMSVPCNSGWHDNIQTETKNMTFSCSLRWNWVGRLRVSLLLFCIEQSPWLLLKIKTWRLERFPSPYELPALCRRPEFSSQNPHHVPPKTCNYSSGDLTAPAPLNTSTYVHIPPTYTQLK